MVYRRCSLYLARSPTFSPEKGARCSDRTTGERRQERTIYRDQRGDQRQRICPRSWKTMGCGSLSTSRLYLHHTLCATRLMRAPRPIPERVDIGREKCGHTGEHGNAQRNAARAREKMLMITGSKSTLKACTLLLGIFLELAVARQLSPNVSTTVYADNGQQSPLVVLRPSTSGVDEALPPSELGIFAEDPRWAFKVRKDRCQQYGSNGLKNGEPRGSHPPSRRKIFGISQAVTKIVSMCAVVIS